MDTGMGGGGGIDLGMGMVVGLHVGMDLDIDTHMHAHAHTIGHARAQDGFMRNFVGDTVEAFRLAGARLYTCDDVFVCAFA